MHCLFWIENAPQIDKNTDEEVVEFINKYVTCELPSHDDSLLDIVTSVQQLSKRHAKTCTKKNSFVIFIFQDHHQIEHSSDAVKVTTIAQNLYQSTCDVTDANNLTPCACVNKKQETSKQTKRAIAKDILSKLKTALSDDTRKYDSVNQLFESAGVNF